MDKVVLSNQDLEFLFKWKDENQDLVRRFNCPKKAIKAICKDSGLQITFARNGNLISAVLNSGSKKFGNCKFRVVGDGSAELVKDNLTFSDKREDRETLLTLYCTLMAVMTYGHLDNADDVERAKHSNPRISTKSSSSKKPDRTTYILRTSNGKLQMVPKSSHASPSGTFSVRGHYRHYKNGKVVWISEYKKGTGKDKSKTYKVKGKGK